VNEAAIRRAIHREMSAGTDEVASLRARTIAAMLRGDQRELNSIGREFRALAAGKVHDAPSEIDVRDAEIVRMRAAGMTNKEISLRLNVAPNTVAAAFSRKKPTHF